MAVPRTEMPEFCIQNVFLAKNARVFAYKTFFRQKKSEFLHTECFFGKKFRGFTYKTFLRQKKNARVFA